MVSIMTFRLDAFVAKIQSPIIFVADGVESSFESGKDLAIYDFSKRHTVKSLYTKDGKIVIEAEEMKINVPFNYAGEAALL